MRTCYWLRPSRISSWDLQMVLLEMKTRIWGISKALCNFCFACWYISYFIGIGCAQQCVTSATSESSKDLLRRGRVGRGRGILVLRAEADVIVSSEVFGAFLCCCCARAFAMRMCVDYYPWYFPRVETVSI